MSLRILGIDLAVSAKHKATILDPATNTLLVKQMSFRARPADLDRLVGKARQGMGDEGRLVAVMEATGMAWYPVGGYLHRQGVCVYRVNGRQTKRLRQVYSPHARSDRIDSETLSRLYLVAPDELVRWLPPTGEQLHLQRLCREADRLRRRDVAIQNRLHSYDQWAWGGLHKLVPTDARAWMRRHWYDPWQVQSAGLTHLEQAWASESAETREWMAAWLKRAEEMTRLYGSPQMVGYPQLQALIGRELDRQQQVRRQRQWLLTQHIEPLYRRLYPEALLETLLGVGMASAATYMAFIQDIHRFATVSAFCKWCGIVPRSNQSGASQTKGLGITQAGPNLIKATLYQNAEVARQWDVQIAQVYHTQMVRYGKHHTQAVCACASHLARRIYALLTQNRAYELRDTKGRPVTQQQSRQLILDHFQVPEHVRKRRRTRHRAA